MKKSLNHVNLAIFLITLFLFFFTGSCEKSVSNPVPDTYVNVYFNLNNYPVGVGQAITISHAVSGTPSLGYDDNGIIVYRNSQDEFFAYDRTCPFHVEESIAVNLSQDNLFAVCPVCGSTYQLFYYGFPTEGSPSEYPLKQYRISYNQNTYDLYISN